MKKNVLVLPCGSEIGLEIHKAMGYSTHFELYGASSVPDHGEFVYKNYIGNVPYVNAPDFLDTLNAIIDEHNIELIFPAHDSVVLRLAQEVAKGTLHAKVVTSPLETCDIANSKRKTYETFDGVIPTPAVYDANSLRESDLPVFLKPEVGNGSRGTQLAKTLDDIAFYTQKDPSLMALEYLPGREYTIDCLTNKDGKLLFFEGRERTRVAGGISVHSQTVQDARFKDLAHKINGTLTFRGMWFFQVKENASGELVLMEIAPRVAGTMGLVRCKGVILPLLAAFDALDYDIGVFENDVRMVIDRAWQNVYKHDITYGHAYIDFDDLVIFEGKVNPAIMAFIYQCMNKKVKIHLITRHKEVLEDSLKKYRLGSIFDEIIWLQKGEDKADHIEHDDAIFIDDSFAERKKVHDKKHIPTFDAHMIESLMEKF